MAEELTSLRQEVVVLREAVDELREVLSYAVNNGQLTFAEDIEEGPAQPQHEADLESSLEQLATPKRPERPATPEPPADGLLF